MPIQYQFLFLVIRRRVKSIQHTSLVCFIDRMSHALLFNNDYVAPSRVRSSSAWTDFLDDSMSSNLNGTVARSLRRLGSLLPDGSPGCPGSSGLGIALSRLRLLGAQLLPVNAQLFGDRSTRIHHTPATATHESRWRVPAQLLY